MDVVGVVTSLVRGGAQVLHGDQVVELSVLLEVHEKEEMEEDGEGQIEVEGEDELKEKRSCMTMNVDEMRLKNTLSHEVHVTRHQKKDEDYTLSVHAHRLCNLRVSVSVSLYLLLMWFVSCLSSVLVLLFMLYSYSFRGQFSVVGSILFTITVIGLLDVVTVSNSAEIQILFADRVHRRTGVHNKFSFLSCLVVDTNSPKDEKNVVLCFTFNFRSGFTGISLLPFRLFLRPISQIFGALGLR